MSRPSSASPGIPARFIVREIGLVLLAAAAWWIYGRMVGQPAWMQIAFGIVTAALTLIPAALTHEWGHLIGARLGGSVVRFPEGWVAKLLFDFDIERNDRRQFLLMSFGGYVGSLIGVVALWLLLPPGELPTWISMAGAAVGLTVQLLVEGPHTLQVLRGGPIPQPLVTVTKPPN